MSIPELTPSGLLPEELHDCVLEEVGKRFGQFQVSDRRVILYEALQEYVNNLVEAKLAEAIVLDGSFITAKDEPGDIDLVVVLPRDHDEYRELRPFEYNLLSRKRVKKYSHEFLDISAAPQDSVAFSERVDFFTQVKGETDVRKGLLRVLL